MNPLVGTENAHHLMCVRTMMLSLRRKNIMFKNFENREQAGKILAEKLIEYKDLQPVILALPRGGVPIGYEVAVKLHAPLDVVLVKKIGAPGHEEFAIGAIAEDEKPILDERVINQYRFSAEQIEKIIFNRINEIRARSKIYRSKFPAIPLHDRTVIIVDDGLATGATMKAAISWVKTQNVKKIIVAVPVSSDDAADAIKSTVDVFVSLVIPDNMVAVGKWYQDFQQVSDEEVMQLLQKQTGKTTTFNSREVWIKDDMAMLQGVLNIPPKARGIVLFAHGGGSSHKSPRNIFVAKALNEAGFGTLLFDLLTPVEAVNRKNVFDIELMGKRLTSATEWIKRNGPKLPIGYFGASTGAAAALSAARDRLDIFAVVSRGGRPDLAMEDLPSVFAPTLLIVGSEDKQVITLNTKAKEKLTNCQMVLIPGATHLFEEPGTLEQVVEYAVSWFTNSLSLHVEKKIDSSPIKENIVKEIEDNSTPFNDVSDLESWLEKISKNKIIMLGEATHGTKEFYSIRREISQILIKKYGYKFIAVEGDWPDCNRMNEFIAQKEKSSPQEMILNQFHRWPTWMWANEEIPPLLKWMKENQSGAFYGLDVYSFFESMEELKKQVSFIEPSAAMRIRELYKCFEPFKGNEIAYAKSLLNSTEGCEPQVLATLRAVLRIRLQETSLSREALFDLKQNARVVVNAEKYYRSMLTDGAESWNVRDSHMLETLDNLLQLHGPDAKAIVWAHNTHIGDYHATDMLDNGYVNLGGLARERYGADDVFLLGFSTYQGEVVAGSSWGSDEKVNNLPPARHGTYEDYFHQASVNMNAAQFLTTFDKLDNQSTLNRKLGHRAVGVVYDPDHESRGNYVPTQMCKRYDGIIYVDNTHAVTSLNATVSKDEFPETWPVGQ